MGSVSSTSNCLSPFSPRSVFTASCCSLRALPYRYKMAHRIRDISERLDEIKRQQESSLGLMKVSSDVGPPRELIEPIRKWGTSSIPDASMPMFGREEDKQKIINKLLSPVNDKVTTLVPITGMGGIGKTTLAQDVFNDENVQAYFTMKKWLSVGESFNAPELIQKILGEPLIHPISGKELKSPITLDDLHTCLKHKVKDERFLIVLDDVWSEGSDELRLLWTPLTHNTKGSRVIITTRNQNVVDAMAHVSSDLLCGLSDDDCWSIFEKCAFADEDSDANRRDDLKSIGREIVQKLKGHPLAARVVGSSLYNKYDVGRWTSILESKALSLAMDGRNETIIPILKLSYWHLPLHLKQCFAYCSLFPKDHIFDKTTLVRLWMAQGFVQPLRDTRLEDIGSDYFDDLVYRSLLQYVDGRYVMHDLIHDLAQEVSSDEYLRIEAGESDKNLVDVRHLSIISSRGAPPTEIQSFHKTYKKVRTLMYRRYGTPTPIPEQLYHLKCMRVLVFGGSCFIQKLHRIGDVKHLRYLDLTCLAGLRQVPESLCTLYNLQTLKLHANTKLPEGMYRLVNLRHLEAGELHISNISRIGRLTCLQELKAFRVSREPGHKLEELRGMSQLRGKLGIWDIENVTSVEEATQIRLKDRMIHLVELELAYNDAGEPNKTRLYEEVLEALQPPPHLKSLSIGGTGRTKLPCWMRTQELIPSRLESISLSGFDEWESLPPLVGRLRFLKRLRIEDMPRLKEVGRELDGDMVLSLEELSFHWMPSWEKWVGVEEGHPWFPSLRTLTINGCPKLREMPPIPPSLSTLDIGGCGALTSLSSWLGHREFGGALESLTIRDCEGLVDLWKSAEETCHIGGVAKGHLGSLRKLDISCCPKLHISTEEVATVFVGLTSLTQLGIIRCPGALTALPGEALRHLSKLERLTVDGCQQLESLGLATLLSSSYSSSLRRLSIRRCPKLTRASLMSSSSSSSSSLPSPSPQLESLETDNGKLLAWLLLFRRRFESFQSLGFRYCEEVTAIFEEVEEEEQEWWLNFPSLNNISIQNVRNSDRFPRGCTVSPPSRH